MALVADIAGKKKGEMLSWFSSITIIGNLLGPPLGGLILYRVAGGGDPSLSGFHAAYLVSGVAGLMSLLLALGIMKGEDRKERGSSLREASERFFSGIREVVSDRRIVITSGMEGLQNMSMGALEAFLPIYAVTVVGLNAFQAGLLWGAQVVVTILAKPIMGKLSDRHGRKPFVTAGMFLCALSFGSIPLLSHFSSLMVAALFFGFGEAFVTSSSAALVADMCKEKHFGTAMGTFGTIFDIGHASGPILAGVLIAQMGYLSAFWIISAVLVLAVPVFVLSVRVDNAVQ